MRFAVLASHEGSTLQTVIDACHSQHLTAQVVLVISNNSASGALRRAQAAGIPTCHLSQKTHPDDATRDAAMLSAMTAAEVDYVLLLGYMKKLGSATLQAFSGRILNTHPALLPRHGGQGYFGRRVHQAVLQAGETESGATIHLVDLEYDTGPIVAQVTVPVLAGDTVELLETRVKAAEQKLLVETLADLADPSREASNY